MGAARPVSGARRGWCETDCEETFQGFLLGLFLLGLLDSAGRIGNLLVALRCVPVSDKLLSMAFHMAFSSLLGSLPAPVAFGAVIDYSCALWDLSTCPTATGGGGGGSCLLYNSSLLRRSLLSLTAAITALAVLFDAGVWYYCKDLSVFHPQQDGLRSKKRQGDKRDGTENGPDEEEEALSPELECKTTGLYLEYVTAYGWNLRMFYRYMDIFMEYRYLLACGEFCELFSLFVNLRILQYL